MKENNLNRVIGWSGLLLTSLLSTSALADNIGTSAEELGLSDYRHFVIYPRLDKALKAQKNNDEATAIREFEYIHQQVPDNIPLTLYLAEAYRHFGHDDRARLLLEDQLKRHPGDARLERSLAAIPVEVKSVTTVEELLAQQKACDAAPTLRCRSEVGQNALRLAQLPVARAQLNDATFAASPEGKTLRTDLLQRAIYLKQWSQADTLYNEARQQNTLSAAERRQWFDVLLAGQLDDRILALQSQGIFTDPQSYITYATALAYRGEKARLQHYLIENKPLFTTDAQEKSWLYLLSKYSANPVQALANYTVQFADNRQYVVGATLPVLLKEGQYDAAQKLLATLAANVIARTGKSYPPGSTDLATDAERAVTRSCRFIAATLSFPGRCACQPDFNGATGVSAGKSSLPGNSSEGGDFIKTLAAGGATSVTKPVAGYCR